MPFTPIVGTLGYVMSPDGQNVLLIHRTGRTDDHHAGKYNGLGGKLEAGEDVVACIRREVREEAGIDCDDLVLRGTICWPGFGKSGENWLGFIFRIDRWHGDLKEQNAEGTLGWVPVDQILTLPLWEGDRFFLPLVFDSDPRQFHGVMPYRDGRPLSWSVSFLPAGPTER
jgi:8-oxo-dGTP diphosphatase